MLKGSLGCSEGLRRSWSRQRGLLVLKTMESNKSMCWQSVIRNRVKIVKVVVREANRRDLELTSSYAESNPTVTA